MQINLSVLPPKSKKFFLWLSKRSFIKKFYLAGGTASALYFGHRRSKDLDFFSKKDFQRAKLVEELKKYGQWFEFKRNLGTLVGEIDKIKLSFFTVPEKLISPPFHSGKINIAHPIDLGLMKIMAISDRGTKRDFIDLYILCHKVFPLEGFLKLLSKKFPKGEYNVYHIIRSLVYFADAEKDPMPKMFVQITWKEIKNFFEKEIKRIVKKNI